MILQYRAMWNEEAQLTDDNDVWYNYSTVWPIFEMYDYSAKYEIQCEILMA